jgi:hypothetical protein
MSREHAMNAEAEFETAVAGPASASEIEKVVRQMRRERMTRELDVRRASRVRVGDRQWSFVLTREAVDNWDRLGSEDLTVGVLIYEQPGAAAPFVHREIAVRRRKGRLIVEVRENGLPRWTGEGSIDHAGALEFKVTIDRENSNRVGIMAGQVTRDGELRLTQAKLPRPTESRQPELVAEEQA